MVCVSFFCLRSPITTPFVSREPEKKTSDKDAVYVADIDFKGRLLLPKRTAGNVIMHAVGP